MARTVAMEDAAERGQHADLQWFYHYMERVDVTIQSAIARRPAFVDALDWEIRTVEGADPLRPGTGRTRAQRGYLRSV